VESLAGDVFLLGTTSWRIKRVEPGRVRVEDAHGAAPSIPSGMAKRRGARPNFRVKWRASAARSSGAIRSPRSSFSSRSAASDRRGASRPSTTCARDASSWNAADQSTVVAERFFDESGGMQLILHAPFGSRVNRAWGLALRKRFCRSFNFELQAAATDNGIVISLSDQHSFPLEAVFGFLHPDSVEYVLTQAMLDAPMFSRAGAGTLARAGHPAVLGRQEGPASDSAHALGRSARRGVPRSGSLRGKPQPAISEFPIIRW